MRADKGKNPVVEKSFKFAIAVILFSKILREDKEYVIANQILKSGTSIGANIREAQNAESIQDFIHKMKLAAKEADETEYWLELYNEVKPGESVNQLLSDCMELIKILSSIIATTKRKLSK